MASFAKPLRHSVWGKGILLTAAVLIAALLFAPASQAAAYSQPARPLTTFAADTTTQTQDCQSGSLSWILCPLTELFINSTNFIETYLIVPYLTVSPLTTDAANPVFRLWKTVRNIANIAFIIAFFFVIFSQATSFGLSNYGIKRMLPRLVWVAILANLSYYLVAFLIDIFNIFGAGVAQLVMGVLQSGGAGSTGTSSSAFWQIGLGLGILTVGAAMGWLWSLVGAIFLIILVAVIVLVLRQMLIILLVIISPLLAIAELLPNTEQYASKGWNWLFKLLMMYPLIVLLFAIGKIVGALLASGDIQLASGDANSKTVTDTIKQIFAALAAAAPLLLIPATFAAAGGIISRAHDAVTRRSREWSQKGQQAYSKTSFAQYRQQKQQARDQQVATGNYTTSKWTNWLNPAGHATRLARSRVNQFRNQSGAFNTMTGGYGANQSLTDRTQRNKARAETKELFGGDYNLAEAWLSSGGDVNSKAYKDLKIPAQQAVFRQLANSQYNRSADSYISAMEMLAENGRGTADMMNATERQIQRLNPASATTDINALRNSVGPKWRAAGRGDVTAQMSYSKDYWPAPLANTPRPAGAGGSDEPAWSAVTAKNLSRHAFDVDLTGKSGYTKATYQDPETGKDVVAKEISNGEASLRNYLGIKLGSVGMGGVRRENLRQIVEALPQMENRARKQAELMIFDMVRGRARTNLGGSGTYDNGKGSIGKVLDELRDDLKLQHK